MQRLHFSLAEAKTIELRLSTRMVRAFEFSSFDFEVYTTGYHVYKCGWEPCVNEKLQCEREQINTHDKYTVNIVKSKYAVRHAPRAYSKYVTLLLLNGEFVGVTVKGKHCNPRNNGQEVSCLYSVKGCLKVSLAQQCIFYI